MNPSSEFHDISLTELVDPQTAALIVVDMQNDFCDPAGAIAQRGGTIRHIQDMAPRLRSLLAEARQSGIAIVHVRTHHSPWTNSSAWTRRKLGGTVRCFPNSWGADWYEGFEPRLGPEWSPATHEYVVTKHRYSGFLDTDLDLILRSHRIETIIMTGEATNVCVESTARDGYMRDYNVIFTSDCTAAHSEAEHEAALHNIRIHFGRVVSSKEIVAAWQALGVLPERVEA
ncbi:MAG: cysteine hydrolase [Chloroflexi bacterium]|nr:cysteine hydrolase [Chloroflexota bacterium]